MPITLKDIEKQIGVLTIAERVFDSIVLFSLFATGAFRVLTDGPKTLEQLHGTIGGDSETLRAVLDAAVALKVLTKDERGYSAAEQYLDCLGRPQAPAYLGEWITFLHALSGPLLQLDDAIVNSSKPGALFEEMGGDSEPARRMTAAMHAYARSRGRELVDHVDFSATKRLLDLGCGPGTYAVAILERHPHVHATLLDLPGPIAEAGRLLSSSSSRSRMEFVAADAMEYEPAIPFDTVLISNTLHMLGPEASIRLLTRVRRFISPGGRLIVQAQYLNDDRTSPRWPALLNLIQRVATPHGRNHAIGETTEWMKQAGYSDIEYVGFAVWNVCSCLIGHA